MMRFGSLFSGIGGLDLGLERAGMTCAWQVEIDPYCNRVLDKHWPGVRRYGDVRQVNWKEVEAVDLICGGFPCQPFSVAGKRRGAADERNLWPEMLRVVREVRPSWVLGENVPGIGDYFDTVCATDLEGEGYEVLPLEIPAAAFGAPHLRYRLFIVAHAKRCDGDWGTDKPRREAEGRDAVGGIGEELAHAASIGCKQVEQSVRDGETREESNGASPNGGISDGWGWWAVEPNVGRVANGVPSRVDRLRCLGNAVVPQVAEWLGRRIMECEL